MALAAKLYRDERVADRLAVNLDATLRKIDQTPVDIQIEDLSVTGFRMVTSEPLAIGATITVGISGLGRCRARIVRNTGNQFGCEFLQPVSAIEIENASTARTLAHADFGGPALAMPQGDPPLDAFEQKLRKFRGPIIATALIAPWLLIVQLVRALAS